MVSSKDDVEKVVCVEWRESDEGEVGMWSSSPCKAGKYVVAGRGVVDRSCDSDSGERGMGVAASDLSQSDSTGAGAMSTGKVLGVDSACCWDPVKSSWWGRCSC